MTMAAARVVDTVAYMPDRVVTNQVAPGGAHDPFFDGVLERRFAWPDFSAVDLGTHALRSLLDRTGVAAGELDLIICSTMLDDVLNAGIGSAIQHRVNARAAAVLHVDTGCCSWVSSIDTARAFIESGRYRKVAVVTVTNFISRLTEFQQAPESQTLGDGASATLLVADTSSTICSVHEQAFGENWGTLRVEPDVVDGVELPYWQAGAGELKVRFNEQMLVKLWRFAMEKVPDAVSIALKDAGLSADDVSLLITHQPNAAFIEAWQQRCGIGAERGHNTLAKYGNLFHGSLPITFADALDHGKVAADDVIAFATFTNGGETVSAMVWRWTG
nr:3-oxoacyl-[acyl-carrier-protein] synthase III C-terminal domain-containing protein [Kibdelosporangium sp. MJ126-NF4]CEL13404.1 3-oxoacyl-[acyl-carrier-protein] synthase, KASIII [Kibdelosporangium sp. MJ126-NF4]CTQ99093.1 3-oxoacyl-[acyl-carrier-protein] synthase, KASIII (EC 2.3.1.41) [Kibdelosporangium sp. MJ126-NF4]